MTNIHPCLKKLKLLLIYAPGFIATMSSRLTAFAVVFSWNYVIFSLFVALSLAVPSLLFLILKTWALKDLSVVDLVKAALGEMTTHTLWGGRGREGSRNLQLFMQIYLLILHSSFMVVLPLVNVSTNWWVTPAIVDRLQKGAIVSPTTGWLQRVVLTPLWMFELRI